MRVQKQGMQFAPVAGGATGPGMPAGVCTGSGESSAALEQRQPLSLLSENCGAHRGHRAHGKLEHLLAIHVQVRECALQRWQEKTHGRGGDKRRQSVAGAAQGGAPQGTQAARTRHVVRKPAGCRHSTHILAQGTCVPPPLPPPTSDSLAGPSASGFMPGPWNAQFRCRMPFPSAGRAVCGGRGGGR